MRGYWSGGTAYITDVGMTGPLASVIGIRKADRPGAFLDPNSLEI